MPLGGSLVILTEPCRMLTGNLGLGYDVIHSRKSGLVSSGLSSSTILSSDGIQLGARWQFCSTTHNPLLAPSSMSAAALGPCPCPSDTACSRAAMSRSPANCSSAAVGSLPGDSTKMSGVVGVESAHHLVGPHAPYDEQLPERRERAELTGQRDSMRLGGRVQAAPRVGVNGNARREALPRRQAVEPPQLAPPALREPIGCRVGHVAGRADAAGQQEHPLIAVDLPTRLHDAGAQQEGKEQFVLFEERAAHVAEERVGEVVVDVREASRQVVALVRGSDTRHKEVDEPRQAVLVHWVDRREVGDAEEEDGRVVAARRVARACVINLLLGHLGDLLLLGNVIAEHFGLGDDGDGRLVLQDVALAAGQHLQEEGGGRRGDEVVQHVDKGWLAGAMQDVALAARQDL
eukprot:248973-Chlamydomonas_euryale.AAC.1